MGVGRVLHLDGDVSASADVEAEEDVTEAAIADLLLHLVLVGAADHLALVVDNGNSTV